MNTVVDAWLRPMLARWPKTLPGLGRPLSIGLELGPERLNLIQMKRAAGKAQLHAMASLPYPCARAELQPPQLKLLLKQAYALQPFKGQRVVSCLPLEHLKLITVAYTPGAGQADADAIVAELRERMKDELDRMVVDFMTLRQEKTDTGKHEALVALAPREKVIRYLDLLDAAGLEVDALDIGPAALARLVSYAGEIYTPGFPNLPNALLLNFGADASFMSVIWGRRLLLDRSVEFSENRLLARLHQVLNMPQELAFQLPYQTQTSHVPAAAPGGGEEVGHMLEEVLRPVIGQLLQEINKTLGYMASRTHGKSVDHLYLAGRVARYPGLSKSLREQLNIPVLVLNPVTLFASESMRLQHEEQGTLAGMALTTGLALRGVANHG
jgi:type IV pilus assembly protein PilM